MKVQFNAAVAKRSGSGWSWLGWRPDGTLAISSTPHQDNLLQITRLSRHDCIHSLHGSII